MKTAALTICLLLLSVGALRGQSTPEERDAAQRSLSKALSKNTYLLTDISVKECKASFVSDGAILSLTNRNSRTAAGGSFPSDESNVYLSSGPDKDMDVPIVQIRYKFELKDVDVASVRLVPFDKGSEKLALIVDSIDRKETFEAGQFGKTLKRVSRLIFQVKKKSAEETADLFRKAVTVCKQ